MKKFLAWMIVLAILFSLAACGNKKTQLEENNTEVNDENKTDEDTDLVPDTDNMQPVEDKNPTEDKEADKKEETEPVQTKPSIQEKPSKPENSNTNTEAKPSTPAVEEKPAQPTPPPAEEKPVSSSLGQTLSSAFQDLMKGDKSYTVQELAEALVANDAISFSGSTYSVTEGFLSGFNSEISGFSEGVCFGPIIGSIPFIGYVFKAADGTSTDAFVQTLKDNANRRWNICTEADETVVTAVGNTVFFIMCPLSMDE